MYNMHAEYTAYRTLQPAAAVLLITVLLALIQQREQNYETLSEKNAQLLQQSNVLNWTA